MGTLGKGGISSRPNLTFLIVIRQGYAELLSKAD